MLNNPMTLLVAIIAAVILTILAMIVVMVHAYRLGEWKRSVDRWKGEVDRDRTVSKVFMKEARADTDRLREDFNRASIADGQPQQTEGNQ